MPWQLVSRQAGLLGATVEKVQSGGKNRKPLPGAGDPGGGGRRSQGAAEPAGSPRGARWLSSRPVTRLPRAALSALAGRCHGLSRGPGPGRPIAAPKRQQSGPGPPSLTGAPRPHLLRRESLASWSAPPLPPAGNRLAPAAGSRLLRRTRQAQLCAQACVSGTETTRDPEEAGSACHLAGWRGVCAAAGAAGRWRRSRLFWACTRTTSSPDGTWETAAGSVQE